MTVSLKKINDHVIFRFTGKWVCAQSVLTCQPSGDRVSELIYTKWLKEPLTLTRNWSESSIL
jgi:hypothetical protein